MPDRTVAEAVGDLRLSDKRLQADLAQIRVRLLAAITTLETDAAVKLRVRVDDRSMAAAFTMLSSTAEQFAPTAIVHVNTDQAHADLAALANVELAGPTIDVDTAPAEGAVEQFSAGAGQSLERAGQAGGSRFAQSLGRTVSGAVSGIALAAGGFVATALFKGFDRFNTIQDATASLTVQLGSATRAATLLDGVLKVVQGTPFNLDQFSRAAANMVTFGIAAQKIPGYLTAIGEAAASQGGRANEMAQQLSQIFGRVSSLGRLSGDDIQSFSSTGVNALAILGNAYNRSTEQVRDMISNGLIPASKALDLISAGILNGSTGIAGTTVAFAGTMAKLNDTLTGSISSFGAATARFGVKLIEPFKDTLVSGFQGAAQVLDRVGATVAKALGDISTSDAAVRVKAFFKDLPDEIDPLLDRLSKLGPLIAPIAGAFAALGATRIQGALGPLGQLIPASLTNPLLAATVALVAFTPALRDQLLPLAKQLGPPLAEMGKQFLGIATGLIDKLIPVAVDLVKVFERMMPVITTGLEGAGTVIGIAATAIGTLADVLTKIPLPVLTALVTAFVAFKAVGAAGDTVRSIAGGLERMAGTTPVLARTAEGLEQVKRSNRADGSPGFLGSLRSEMSSTEKVVGAGAAAIGGALAATALSAHDSASQITGLIGSIGAIATGFAVGGPIGGGIATLGVALGAVVGFFTHADDAAKEFKRHQEEVSKALADSTKELLKNKDALGGVTSATDAAAIGYQMLGAAILADQDKAKGAKTSAALADLGLPSADAVGANLLIRVINQIRSSASGIANVPELIDKLNNSLGAAAPKLSKVLTDLINAGKGLDGFSLADSLKLTTADFDALHPDDFSKPLTQQQEQLRLITELDPATKKIIADIIELKKTADDNDPTATLRRSISDTIASSSEFKAAWAAALGEDAFRGVTLATATQTELIKAQAVALDLLANNRQVVIDQEIRDAALTVTNAVTGKTFTDAEIDAKFRLAALNHINVLDTIDLGKAQEDAWLKDEAAIAEAAKTTKDAKDAAAGIPLVIDEATASAKRLQDATDAVTKSASALSDEYARANRLLSDTTGLQDNAKGFRDMAKTLQEIVNQKDIDNFNTMIATIAQQKQSLEDAISDADKSRGDAEAKKTALEAQRDEALAHGATRGAALIQHEIDTVFDDANKKQKKVNDEQTKLADEQAKLAKIPGVVAGAAPVAQTGLQQLLAQAAAAHQTLTQFLIDAPTDQANSFFQSFIAARIKFATDKITEIEETQGPAAAKDAIKRQTANLVAQFVSGGLDPQTAQDMVDRYFDGGGIASRLTDKVKAAQDKVLVDQKAAWDKLSLQDKVLAVGAGRGGPFAGFTLTPAEQARAAQEAALRNATTDAQKLDAITSHPTVEMDLAAKQALKKQQDLLDKNAKDNPTSIPLKLVPGTAAEIVAMQTDLDAANLATPVKLVAFDPAHPTPAAELQALLDDAKLSTTVEGHLVWDSTTAGWLTWDPKADNGGGAWTLASTVNASAPPVVQPQQPSWWQAFQTATGATSAPVTSGSRRNFREGGIANWPGTDRPHVAEVVPAGTWRVFAEPETGGEGYIPLARSKRARSTAVLTSIAELFGLDVLPKQRPIMPVGAGRARDVAEAIGEAVARHTSSSRARDSADRYDRAVHVEAGAIVIQETSTPRRTATRVISSLAELAWKR